MSRKRKFKNFYFEVSESGVMIHVGGELTFVTKTQLRTMLADAEVGRRTLWDGNCNRVGEEKTHFVDGRGRLHERQFPVESKS